MTQLHEYKVPIQAEALLEQLRADGLVPEDVIALATERPIVIHGKTVMIARTSCHCGGDWAWMHERPSGAWEMKGCICHNPAVGP